MIRRLRRAGPTGPGLRARLTVGLLAIALVTCIGFAFAIYEFIDILQDELQYDTLDRELSSVVLDYKHGVPVSGPRDEDGWVFVSPAPGADSRLPAALAPIPDHGHSLVRYRGRDYYAGRRNVDNTAIFMLLNVEDVKQFERRLVTIGAATLCIVIVLALFISLVFSSLILRPVRRLAARLSSYRPGESNPPIAADYGGGDMRDIAESFDALIGRFNAVLAREKAFTEDASHELRTPLAVAFNASELLVGMAELDPRARARAQRVHRACERMQRAVSALLYLARDQHRDDPVVSDAAVVLDEVLIYQQAALTAHRIALSVDARSTPLALPEGVVYSVLHNLIDNAVAHTIDGELRVRVTPERIGVVDTGCGMAESVVARILDRRYRTPTSPGVGIGLYLVSRICDRQGWTIHVESALGQGTSVEIRLYSNPA